MRSMGGETPPLRLRCPGCRAPWRLIIAFVCSAREMPYMSVDAATVKRVAHLARIALPEAEVLRMQGEINAILGFVEELSKVDVEGVEPMTSVTPMRLKQREDGVTDGGIADAILANAPMSDDHFFVVPKVVE